MSDEKELEIMEPLLEAPPSPELPASTSGALFEGDPLAMNNSKLMAIEGIYGLINRDHTFNDFMRELLLVIMKVVRSEAGSIFELDQEHSCFFFRTSVGQVSDRLGKFTVPVGKGIVGHVAESRSPLVVSDAGENKVHLKIIGDAVGFETRNLVALPLVIRGRVFGVLELLNRVGETTYTESDVELLSYICEAASRAIEVRLMIAWACRSGQGQGDRSAA